MTMELPERIQVAGIDYAIAIDTNELANKEAVADCSNLLKRIRLRRNLSEQVLGAALIHEIVHAVDFEFLGDQLEEKQIIPLANGIYQCLRQLGFKVVYGKD